MIYISSFPEFNPPDSEFVMTTWHENESIENVIWDTLNITDFEEYHFDEYLIIQINKKLSDQDIIEKIN
jgi:hypothetical protein